MSVSTASLALDSRLPAQDERAAARQLQKILALQASDEAQTLTVIDPVTRRPADVTLTPALSALLIEVLRLVGAGDAVRPVPLSRMLTTQQAAEILNVSRPFLIGLLERGDLPHEKVGRHRRIRAEDLFAYKSRRDERRDRALVELAEIDAQLL